MTTQAAQTMPTVPQAFFDEFGVNADDRVMDYGRACYEAGLNAGRHPDALPDGTLSKSTAKRVTALAAASVSERARALMAAEYRTHGWHEDAGRLCMGGDPTSFVEDDALRVIARLIEEGDEDTHVITEMGRLLAAIAITLKGPEPAGTAWSYHDLPSLVASEVAEPRQVAAEMKAWAHTKMAEQQSSRRDRMMVSEWAKRLLPESSFPIKDFDVEGMSITKEAVKRVALEQALTQQRVAEWSDDLRAVLDAASEASQVPLMWLANQDFSPEQTKAWLCEAVDATVEEGAFSGSLHQVAEEGTGHVVAFTGCGPKSAANAKFLIWCVHFILKHRDALATTPQPSADAVLVPRGAAETARTVAEEWLAMFSDIPGLEKYERYTYGPAVEQLRDELESLLSGGFHA